MSTGTAVNHQTLWLLSPAVYLYARILYFRGCSLGNKQQILWRVILLLGCKSNRTPDAIKMQLTMVSTNWNIHTYTHTCLCTYVHACALCVYTCCVDMYMCVDKMYQCKRCIYSLHAAECVTLQFINTYVSCNIKVVRGFTSDIFSSAEILWSFSYPI